MNILFLCANVNFFRPGVAKDTDIYRLKLVREKKLMMSDTRFSSNLNGNVS